MTLTGEELKVGNVYLVKVYSTVQEIYVERIAKTAYKLRKEKSDGTWYTQWVTKIDFEKDYKLLEFLNTTPTPPQLESEKAKIEYKGYENKICPICDGIGRLPDDKTTGGTKICPKCWGSGYII